MRGQVVSIAKPNLNEIPTTIPKINFHTSLHDSRNSFESVKDIGIIAYITSHII